MKYILIYMLAQTISIILKLCGVIHSWFWTFSPMLLVIVAEIIIFTIVMNKKEKVKINDTNTKTN